MKSSKSVKYLIWSSILSLLFVTHMHAQVTDTIQVKPGWNLLSLPVKVVDGTKSTLFPTAVSDAFIYQGNYVAKDTLENGYGFWLKFDTDETILIHGAAIFEATIHLYTGWNMIGSLTTPVLVSTIKSKLPGLFISDFFKYAPEVGYQQADTIYPGFCYWVKVIQDSVINLTSMGVPCRSLPTIEYAGKTYNTVQIGSQCWLRENLNVGAMIQGSDTAKDNGIIEKYCYNNNPANCNTYGGLYSWNEAMQYSTTIGARGICPLGWHIPTYAEFQTCSTAVDGDGNAMKAIGQGTGGGTGTNTSGFSALLSGSRLSNGNFASLNFASNFWSSTENSSSNAYLTQLYYSNSVITSFGIRKDYGFSVRCLED